jgi:hypothetical protein
MQDDIRTREVTFLLCIVQYVLVGNLWVVVPTSGVARVQHLDCPTEEEAEIIQVVLAGYRRHGRGVWWMVAL